MVTKQTHKNSHIQVRAVYYSRQYVIPAKAGTHPCLASSFRLILFFVPCAILKHLKSLPPQDRFPPSRERHIHISAFHPSINFIFIHLNFKRARYKDTDARWTKKVMKTTTAIKITLMQMPDIRIQPEGTVFFTFRLRQNQGVF